MDVNTFLDTILFSFAGYDFSWGILLRTIAILAILFLVYRVLKRRLLPRFAAKKELDATEMARGNRFVNRIFILLAIILLIWGLQLDYELYRYYDFNLWVSTIPRVLLILQFARVADWLLSKVVIKDYYKNYATSAEDKFYSDIAMKEYEISGSQTIQYVVYVFAIIFILRSFKLDFVIYSFNEYDFKLTNIFAALLIILMAQVIIWVITHLLLFRYYKQKDINIGSQYAINQLFKYFIYIIAFFMAVESLGIQMTVLWGGAAALLVGVGLALQQTFNDLISGIILLFERSIEVGDVVNVSGMIGTVKRIGLRTSIVESVDNVTLLVPNSKFINEQVINWSHFDEKVRFKVSVGVAYGSDTQLVRKLLLKVAQENIYVLEYPSPFVRFVDFGSSSLDFELFFHSRNLIVIETIKSDMRFEIDQLFREHNIEIPFPQRDIWIKSGGQ